LPPALAGRGVLASAGLAEHSALLAGGDVAVSDPPDHRIHTAAGLWAYRGALHGKVALEHPFDLTDGDGAELLDGESFWAALTPGPGSVQQPQLSRLETFKLSQQLLLSLLEIAKLSQQALLSLLESTKLSQQPAVITP
jgi:hypothetical protein